MEEIKRDVTWDKAANALAGLQTDKKWTIQVQREAIPLVFVPGIMGSRLRRKLGETDPGLPDMRWDPGVGKWMLEHYSGAEPAFRKAMLVGPHFQKDYLEVVNGMVGDGFDGIMHDYREFLEDLRRRDWEALGKIFEFPVYAVGYNWTDSAERAGKALATRIEGIRTEAEKVTGLCKKVILITHSMGGIVARVASELERAKGSIIGIIHGVQPTLGAAAAYWRIKAGFEGLGPTSRILGNSAATVTPILGNIPGGLQLLPNKRYPKPWLRVTRKGTEELSLPLSNPYSEIYEVPAVVRPFPGQRPSTNRYWGLVDATLLDPGRRFVPHAAEDESEADAIDRASDITTPWEQYKRLLKKAEVFHELLNDLKHEHTFCFRGTGHSTADRIELRIESNWTQDDPYPKRGFRGFFVDADGNDMQAVLRDPAGQGDGTVPLASSGALDDARRPPPGDQALELEHQPAYEERAAQQYTIAAIIALAKMRYEDRRAGKG